MRAGGFLGAASSQGAAGSRGSPSTGHRASPWGPAETRWDVSLRGAGPGPVREWPGREMGMGTGQG